jgi:L-threonylcarbamoyladenylate synthase
MANIETRGATAESIAQAAAILRRGGLVAFPTETVYGLGADAENPAAVRAMFAAKGRPADHPVIVHLAATEPLDAFAAEVPRSARQLAAAFWPGPMTLVLRRSRRISDLVTGGLETVGLRVPSHPVAQALLVAFGGPIAAPSANRFGRVSATCARHVAEDAELAARIDLILDGGESEVGLESTIIDLSRDRPAILRPGGVTAEQVAAVLGDEVGGASDDAPRVSGSLASHYAPRARVELVPAEQLAARALELARGGQRVAALSRDVLPLDHPQITCVRVAASDDLFARGLYAALRRADELGCDVALASLPGEAGLGSAIADRLRRAAGPRERPIGR